MRTSIVRTDGYGDGVHFMAEVRAERGQRQKDWHTETDFCPKASHLSRNRPCLSPSNACSKRAPDTVGATKARKLQTVYRMILVPNRGYAERCRAEISADAEISAY